MRARALASLLLTGLSLTGFAQLDYHPLEVGSKSEKASVKNAKLPVWASKPEALSRLAPEKPMYGWAIRPPKGFVSTQKSDGLNQVYIFQGDPRPDRTSPVMLVITGDARHVVTKLSQEEEVMNQYMIQLHQNRDDWKVSPSEAGRIQGRKFLRCHWTGTQVFDGHKRRLRGIVYLTLAGKKFAAVTLQDTDPGTASTLSLMEIAMFTFHKR